MKENKPWHIDVFFIIYGISLVIGIAVCLSFIFALFRGRKVLNKWPFYRIVWSLATMDTIFMIVQVIYFPSMISTNGNRTREIERPEVISVFNSPIFETTFDIISYVPKKGVLLLTVLKSLNRLAVFLVYSLKTLFSRNNIRLTIIITWFFILMLSVLAELLQPTQEWNRELLKFESSGPAYIDVPGLQLSFQIVDYTIPFVIVAIYITIYLKIRKERRFINSGSSTGEIRIRGSDDNKLLYQGIIIASFLQLSNVVNIVSTIIEQDDWLEILLNVFDLTTSVLNHSVHSFLFLLTNPTIRSFLPQISFPCCERSEIQ